MHDPFQTHSMWGGYPGVTAGLNPMMLNPLTAGSPYGQPFGAPGIPGYGGIHPQQLQQQHLHQQLQQLQLAALLTSQAGIPQLFGQSPFTSGWQNPLLSQQNPLLSQSLQNPLLNPILAQYYQSQYPQAGYGNVSPFGQTGSPFGQTGYPLAPQSWIGQQGLGGSPFGQGHPLLSQLVGRGFQGHGISPWSGF